MEKDRFFSAQEYDSFSFIRFPRAFFSNAAYRELSLGAKVLYSLMLDRMGLSEKNGWADKDNCAYIVFKEESAATALNCSIPSARKVINELESAGLIRRKKRGQGKPALIYVLRF